MQFQIFGTLLFLTNVYCIPLTHHRTLKEGVYDLAWGYNDTHITFKVQVKTSGYVGLGVSPNGGMANSDIVIGWVKDGVTYLKDRFATGKSTPVIDANQDVTLESGSENGTHTTLRFTRKRNACDEQDRSINVGTVRLIWSYHDTDPASETDLQYHGNLQRGTISIHLITPVSAQSPPKLPDDTFTVDFLNQNVSVPNRDTTYYCTGFKLPKYNRKHHLIKYEPIIQPGHETLVHHILIYACWHKVNVTAHHGKEWICYTDNMPPDLHECTATIISWAIGGLAYDYPADVGLPIGTDQDPDFVIMETHYDNPGLRSDFVDASGIRLHLTPTTRTYDAGMLEVGYTVSPVHLIPPHFDPLISRGICSKNCLQEGLGAQTSGIKVFGALLHTHLLGTGVHIRHIRNGIEQPWIAYDDNYDFNYQDMFRLETPVTVLPGDELVTDCMYSTTGKNTLTFGGLTTKQEMCLGFLLYYPRVNLTDCRSSLQPQDYAGIVGDSFNMSVWYRQMYGVDFTNAQKREAFQKLELTHNKASLCGHGYIRYPNDLQTIQVPTVTLKYSPSGPTCSTNTPSTGEPTSGSVPVGITMKTVVVLTLLIVLV